MRIFVMLTRLFVYVVETYAVWSLQRRIRSYPMQDFFDVLWISP